MVQILRSWWQNFDVGDILWIMVADANVKKIVDVGVQNGQNRHQHIPSPAFVTNIDVTSKGATEVVFCDPYSAFSWLLYWNFEKCMLIHNSFTKKQIYWIKFQVIWFYWFDLLILYDSLMKMKSSTKSIVIINALPDSSWCWSETKLREGSLADFDFQIYGSLAKQA